jgi:hypothetical protein
MSGRELAPDELQALVDDLAAHPERWAGHVVHDGGRRHHVRFLEDDHVEVWLICWSEDHDTGYHDHDVSAGAVHVVAGAVREERLVLGAGGPAVRMARAGESFTFTASDIHRVLHEGDVPAVTIHAYSPRLRRQGAYVIEPDGRLRRHAIDGEESLRPLGEEEEREAAPVAG